MDNFYNKEYIATYNVAKEHLFVETHNNLYIPISISYYLKWLSEKLNSNYLENYKKKYHNLKSELEIKAHVRSRDGFAHQLIAFQTFMDYAEE
jgi:hypothetical protein